MIEKEPITPEFYENDNCSLYSYEYCDDNFDKIYYSKGDVELRKDMLKHNSITKTNPNLAGDINDEFEIDDDQLISRLEEMLIEHLSIVEYKPITRINTTNPAGGMRAWINYMSPTEYNPVHDHSGIFSFVWYLDIPEEVREEWKKQHGNDTTRGCIQFFSQVVANQSLIFSPQTNDLFLFNAKHQHTVYPYYSDNTRISLAGNIYDYE